MLHLLTRGIRQQCQIELADLRIFHRKLVKDAVLRLARVPAEPNRLSNQSLVRTFEEEWGRVHE